MAASLGQLQERGVLWGVLSCPWQPALLSPGLLGLAFGAGSASARDFTLDSERRAEGGPLAELRAPQGRCRRRGPRSWDTQRGRRAGALVLWVPAAPPSF